MAGLSRQKDSCSLCEMVYRNLTCNAVVVDPKIQSVEECNDSHHYIGLFAEGEAGQAQYICVTLGAFDPNTKRGFRFKAWTTVNDGTIQIGTMQGTLTSLHNVYNTRLKSTGSPAEKSGIFGHEYIPMVEAFARKINVTAPIAAPFIQGWLRDCLEKHAECAKAYAGDTLNKAETVTDTLLAKSDEEDWWGPPTALISPCCGGARRQNKISPQRKKACREARDIITSASPERAHPPTRLLKITLARNTLTDNSPPPTIKLVETTLEGRLYVDQYVALSHCWGPPEKRPLCTIKANLKKHKREIPFTSLPPTFQDATMVCALLGVSYLWIDSLCIVQDDKEDWKKAGAIMHCIYEQALFTICADAAEDSSQGLFHVRRMAELSKQMVQLPFHADGEEGREAKEGDSTCTKSSLILLDNTIRHDIVKGIDRSHAPLNSRCWTLQESMLSRRLVSFTAFGIACRCPSLPWDQYGGGVGSRLQRRAKTEVGYDISPANPRELTGWVDVVQEYTSRNLTYKSDKLAALQGIAAAFCRKKRWRYGSYSNGVWLNLFPAFLCWFPRNGRVCRDIPGSPYPTWSWASTTGAVEFDLGRSSHEPGSLHGMDGLNDGTWVGDDADNSACRLIAPFTEEESQAMTPPGALLLEAMLIPFRAGAARHDCDLCVNGNEYRRIRDESVSERWHALSRLQREYIDRCWKWCGRLRGQDTCPADDTTLDYANGQPVTIANSMDKGSFMGWCFFDDGGVAPGPLYFLPLWRVTTTNVMMTYERKFNNARKRAAEKNGSEERYKWLSLIVSSTEDGSPNAYRRVGLGYLLVPSWIERSTREEVLLV
ncbi:heterokaryon incompatibility protein-domain-containing protein [Neurospora tetraspora]|uniref:Heterokaryon incompatibility protein-domain-containing protein n=1 Tax=Neurospora tetraspora TaxID=94610 RepID=A0AAE0JA29_9PEZI|nr:heterokaryon incompatibility protein-domain-containing protein [Neurospora tetraspora]